MARTIKQRLAGLEAQSRDQDGDFLIVVGLDQGGHAYNRFYKDGDEISKAQFDREHKPKPGEPIDLTLSWDPIDNTREGAKEKQA